MSCSAILPPLKKKQCSIDGIGHFYFAQIGHYHFAATGVCDRFVVSFPYMPVDAVKKSPQGGTRFLSLVSVELFALPRRARFA